MAVRDVHGLRHAACQHAAGARPKLSVEAGHLDMTYDSRAGQAVWRTCRDEQHRLMPYTYDVSLVGTDARGDAMGPDLNVTPSRAPVPLGAAAHNGKIACFGQDGTYSYFQTRMAMTGTLRWELSRSQSPGVRATLTGNGSRWSPTMAGQRVISGRVPTSGARSTSTMAST